MTWQVNDLEDAFELSHAMPTVGNLADNFEDLKYQLLVIYILIFPLPESSNPGMFEIAAQR